MSEADELVRLVRAALRPTNEDRERVFRALVPRIGGGAGAGVVGVRSEATLTAKGAVAKVSAFVLALGIAGGGSFLAFDEQKPLVASAHLTRIARPLPPLQASNVALAASPTHTAARAQRPAPKSLPGAHASQDLAREVAILSRAGSELHAGHPFEALKELEEHQRAFPRGALAQERSAATIQALCALDRKNEARAELAQLARLAPSSPHEARARRTCGFE
jgi:hypothetical protein